MLFRSRFDRRVVRTFSLSIGNDIISPKPIICNLGFYMDCSASMTPHVDKICKSVLFHIRQIGQLRKYLDQASTEKLVHAVISSRLDYANSLLYGLPATSIYKLQRVQNLAARIVTKSPRNSHITPILKSLHWLPVEYRIQFKILSLTFRALTQQTPKYLSDILQTRSSTRPTRSQQQSQLQIPHSRTVTYGDRAFFYSAPSLWNSLPSTLRSEQTLPSFKKKLKTHLFRLCFN